MNFRVWLENAWPQIMMTTELNRQKDIVFRKTDLSEWNQIKIFRLFSGEFWSSDPNEYAFHEDDFLLVAKRKGSIVLRGVGLPKDREEQKRLFDSGELDYNNLDRKELSDIIAAYKYNNGKLVKDYSR